MQLSEFDFPFDPSLVATEPAFPREQAKLLVLNPTNQAIMHRRVADLVELLDPGDLMVVNDTRVRPARVTGRKRASGRPVEMVFVKPVADREWEVLMKGTWRAGQAIEIDGESDVTVLSREGGRTVVQIGGALPIPEWFRVHGRMPLPPYIKRPPTDQDRDWYQTIFARDEGAIAAPTAGLHFTPALLSRLSDRHIELATITLHVGVGTFKPVTVDCIEEHQMEAESVEVGSATVRAIERVKAGGRKVVAVGTTVVRAIETAALQGMLQPYRGETSLFIRPGFQFKVVDALLTNFHLPQTTLLMLVSAFAGTGFLRRAYEEAVQTRYRFYSYGDAMLVTDRGEWGARAVPDG
jgi:S-adenosylmethionine:tRNA ribosyltransferase-isomerase